MSCTDRRPHIEHFNTTVLYSTYRTIPKEASISIRFLPFLYCTVTNCTSIMFLTRDLVRADCSHCNAPCTELLDSFRAAGPWCLCWPHGELCSRRLHAGYPICVATVGQRAWAQQEIAGPTCNTAHFSPCQLPELQVIMGSSIALSDTKATSALLRDDPRRRRPPPRLGHARRPSGSP